MTQIGEARGTPARAGWVDAIASTPVSASVLIVDDELEIRKSLQRLLTRFGHDVRTAASAEEADQWLAAQRFDLCLLDIELPRMRGTEFLNLSLSRDPEMAVIMLTGLDLPEVAIECLDHGARTYLLKPVEADFLRLAVRDALSMRRVLAERNDLASRV